VPLVPETPLDPLVPDEPGDPTPLVPDVPGEPTPLVPLVPGEPTPLVPDVPPTPPLVPLIIISPALIVSNVTSVYCVAIFLKVPMYYINRIMR